MQTDSAQVLVIGAAMVDIVCNVGQLPQSGEGIVPTSVTKTVGGCALNSAAMLKYLGVEPLLFAPVGQGLFSTIAKETITALGLTPFEPLCIDRSHSALAPSAAASVALTSSEPSSEALPTSSSTDCGACICLVEPDGERTMITIPGIERHFTATWFSTLSEAQLSALKAVIVCGYELETPGGDDILAFLEKCPSLQVFYAPGPRVCAVSPDRVERLRRLRAIWHLNDQEVQAYTGASSAKNAGQQLAEELDAPVIVTAGSQGSFAFVPKTAATFVPSTPVVPVNTVGAGDAHVGATVAQWVQGDSWAHTLACANEAAARICLIEGTTLMANVG